jgi:glutaredoxin 3
MGAPKVLMYASPWCGHCARARTLLGDRGIAFVEIDVDATPGARTEMIERSGGRSTVPQIFIGERYIGGSDELYELDAAGRLDPMLK